MKDTLIPLAGWNRRRMERYHLLRSRKSRPNGIACPECGSELLDTDTAQPLSSSPPRLAIHCEHCRFRGYRVA